MSPYRRNVLVGITVILALAALGWMILKFSGNIASIFTSAKVKVQFVSDRADGVADGSTVTYHGIEVGYITRVWLANDRQRTHFEGSLNADPPLPGNLKGLIKTASLLGAGSTVALESDGPPASANLKSGDVIQARYVGLGELLPPAFGKLAEDLSAVARQFHDSQIVAHLDEQVIKAGKLIESIDKLVGDDKQREDIKAGIANMRDVTERAKTIAANLEKFSNDVQKVTSETQQQVNRAGDNIDSLTRQMGDRLTQVAKLLDQFQSIAQKIDKGQGTAGQFVNDQRLYESLVDTSRELSMTIKDLKRLVEQWEQEGVSLKLK